MRRIIIIAIILFAFPTLILGYNDTGMYRDGFKLNPNGNDINLGNRTIWNGSFNGTFVGVQTGSDNTKVNKSGDSMIGSLKIYVPTGKDNLSYCGLGLGVSCGEFSIETYNKNNPLSNFNAFRGIGKATLSYPYFFITKIYADWDGINITNRTYIPASTTIGLISFQGNNGTNNNLTGTKARIQVMTDGAWTDLYQNTTIRIWSSSGMGITIDGQGNITMAGLSGSGYAFSCLDSAGKIIRSTISCDLI